MGERKDSLQAADGSMELGHFGARLMIEANHNAHVHARELNPLVTDDRYIDMRFGQRLSKIHPGTKVAEG
jgi:hypothetical protein